MADAIAPNPRPSPGAAESPATPHPIARKILLDTDPGGDDAVALLWLQSLVRQGYATWAGVSTAGGNVAPALTFAAACKLLELGGFDGVPVARAVPFRGAIADAAYVHGADGMGNLAGTLPDPRRSYADAPPADAFIADTLAAHPGEIDLVAIAPLTNLAAAEARSPGVLRLARQIVIMGGAFDVPGNVSPRAEFNFAFDPEAAAAVLAAREDCLLVPLDATARVCFAETRAIAACEPDPDGAGARFLRGLTQFMTRTALALKETAGEPGFLVHDAVAVAYLFYPQVLRLRRARVAVDVGHSHGRGQAIADDRLRPQPGANAWIAAEVDADRLLAALTEDLRFWVADRAGG